MIVATHYIIIYDERRDVYLVRNKDVAICHKCGAVMSGYDHRKRKVIGQDGNTRVFLIRRLRCPICNRVHAELPDSLIAYRHYAAEVISKVQSGDFSVCPADDSTIRRWRQ